MDVRGCRADAPGVPMGGDVMWSDFQLLLKVIFWLCLAIIVALMLV